MAPNVEFQYTLAGTSLAPDVHHLNREFLKNTSHKPFFSLGLMLGGGVVLCAVVPPAICSFAPVCSKLLLGLSAAKPIESQVPVLGSAWNKCRVSHTSCC